MIEQTAIGCLLCWHFGATIEAAEQRAGGSAQGRRCGRLRGVEYSHERPWRAGASPLLGDALNAGYRYLKVKCAGCRKNNMVDLANHPAPKGNANLDLEHRMGCKPCAVRRGYPYERGQLVRLRQQGHAERRRRALLSDQRDRN